MVRAAIAMAALLALAGCTGESIVSRDVHGDVPRDARGEPVFASIPAPPAPAPPPPPILATAAGVVMVTADSTAAAPPVTPLPPPAKPVSCKHFRHCL